MYPRSIVGIDLGTTFSLAAFVEDGVPRVVRDAHGVALVPSCISFHDDGTVLVGSAARERALSDPDHTIFSVKRLMGRTLAELREELKHIPHQVQEREADGGRKVLTVTIGGKAYTPEELSAMILKEVRARAGNPTKAVITVPAYFDDAQRQATRDAGRIAGLDVLRIVNEPTAAALAYGLDKRNAGVIAVYDLGGGTFDCSILQVADGVFRVLATNGDTFLGGDDFDHAIMEAAARRLNVELKDATTLQHFRDAAEKTKIALSSQESVEFRVNLPSRPMTPSPWSGEGHPLTPSPLGGEGWGGGLAIATTSNITDELRPPTPHPNPPPQGGREPEGTSLTTTFTRSEFEAMISPLVERSLAKCKNALADAGKKEVDEVVLVGGSSRVPLVRQRVEAFFKRKAHADLNPDEVVALGAAVQADILAGNRRDMLLLDVVPLSLGIETLGGVVDKVIHRNTTVPCRETVRYSTAVENQTAILVNIYQGERELTKDCRLLGQFKLGGIPPMPAQFPQVDVTFTLDANAMLKVTAIEKRSGQQAAVEVRAAHGLNQNEVERLVLESVEHAHADFSSRRLIEYRNKAEGDLRHTEKAMAAIGQELSDEERTAIEKAIAHLKATMSGTDADALQHATKRFGEATAPLAEKQFNSTVKKLLAGKKEDELDAGNL